ncbi:MAG: O-antigen ligase family protein [Firmicutes bacterium]|nr:O-antigen ligase family protein [Bacillota bacterium]
MNLQKRLVLGLIFYITFANTDVKVYQLLTGTGTEGIIPWQHGFYITLGLAFVLVLFKFNQKDAVWVRSRAGCLQSPNIALPLFLWFVAATFSFFLNMDSEGIIKAYVGGFVSLLIIYLALRDIPMTSKFFNQIMMALSLGTVVTLGIGIIVYYRQWGIPNLITLILSRYDLMAMREYRQITYGNLGNTACLLVLIGPPFLAMAVDKSRPLLMRLWFAGCFLLAGANLLITGARAGFIVMGLAVVLVFFYFRKLGRLVFLLCLGFIIFQAFFINYSLEGMKLFIEHLANAIMLNSAADYSIMSRFEAIREGWAVFCEHWLVGVGPESSSQYISVSTAHQFFIQQGVQLGILGMFATVALVVAVFWRLGRVAFRKGQPFCTERFIFLIGPAMYFLYGVLANLALNFGSVNIWICLMGAFLALADFRELRVDSRPPEEPGGMYS